MSQQLNSQLAQLQAEAEADRARKRAEARAREAEIARLQSTQQQIPSGYQHTINTADDDGSLDRGQSSAGLTIANATKVL